MSDPLIALEPGPPCPNCGSRVNMRALEVLRDSLYKRKLEIERRRREQREQRCNGLVVRDPAALWETGTEIRGAGAAAIDGEICADCGTFWKPNAKVKSAEMREEIRKLRLEVDSAIDILGDLVSNDG